MASEEDKRYRWIERIKERLKILEMTQEELASKMGITRSAINHYLAGRRFPTLRHFEKLAIALETTPGWLYGSTTEIQINPNKLLSALNPIPILTWEEAAKFKDIRQLNLEETKEWVANFYTESTKSYALKIKNDVMTSPTGQTKTFREGDVIILDHGIPAKPGDFVAAILPNSKEVTFKQYVSDGNKYFLKPLNPQYPIVPLDDQVMILAVLSVCISNQTES